MIIVAACALAQGAVWAICYFIRRAIILFHMS